MEKKALPLCFIGVLIAVVPIVALYSPGDRNELAAPVLIAQIAFVTVGIGVFGIGLHSYRTDNLELATATYFAIFSVLAIGIVGALIEMTGGPLIPIWVWVSLLLVAVVMSVVGAEKVVERSRNTERSRR